jgi:hypothetical protein
MATFRERGLLDVIRRGVRGSTIDEASFDSELIIRNMNDTTNADLILTLRILFEPVAEPTILDAEKKQFHLLPWNEPDPSTGAVLNFNLWTQDAVEKCSKIWNEKLWLQTPASFAGLDWPRPGKEAKARPNVHCGLRVVKAKAIVEAHSIVRVARLDPNRAKREFTSRWDLWDSDDSTAYPTGRTVYVAAAHEVGHLLGLHHIGGKGPCAYTKEDGTGSPNVMGKGGEVWKENALPWQRAMEAHTLKATAAADWIADSQRFRPGKLVNGTLVR